MKITMKAKTELFVGKAIVLKKLCSDKSYKCVAF